MRYLAILLAMTLAFPYVANAQARQNDTDRKLVKLIVGGSLLVIGAAVVANSGQSKTVTSAVGETNTSSFSTTQLVTGLAIAGTGGIVLWSGLRGRDPDPTLFVGATTGKRAQAVFIRKTW